MNSIMDSYPKRCQTDLLKQEGGRNANGPDSALFKLQWGN
ncbi:hypothetical protein X975_09825, partial [Stegodyphus mimosarum]